MEEEEEEEKSKVDRWYVIAVIMANKGWKCNNRKGTQKLSVTMATHSRRDAFVTPRPHSKFRGGGRGYQTPCDRKQNNEL